MGISFSGCAGHRPVADRGPATPATPSSTPAPVAESAKRATDVPETPANPSAAEASVIPGPDRPAPRPAISGYVEEGNASWYGEPFHGRRASNGEIYDMYKLTAAHRTLPFDTMVRVTNLNNGKSTTVRITDRGPFVDNRIIDLSRAAAREIDLVGPGVARVRIELTTPGVDPTAGFFTVQVGAFRDRGNAERLRDRLSASYSPIFIQQYDSPDGILYRQLSERLRGRETFAPFLVRLDE